MDQQSLFAGVVLGHDGERRDDDYYPTAAPVTRAVLPFLRRRLHASPGYILEPGIGHGAIADVLSAPCSCVADCQRGEHTPYRVRGVDVRPEAVAEASARHDVLQLDFLAQSTGLRILSAWGKPAAVVGNPPFTDALEFVGRSFDLVGDAAPVAMLLRLAFLASLERAAFWRHHPADVLVLDKRPSFTGNGKGGKYDMAWFIWPAVRPLGQILRVESRL